MPGKGRSSNKTPKQSKLTDFGPQSTGQLSLAKEATSKEMTANVDTSETEEACGSHSTLSGDNVLHVVKEEILGELRSLRSEFSGRFDGVMKAISDTQKQVAECEGRLDEAEVRISHVEDDQNNLKSEVEKLGKRNKHLEEKVIDLETRSRLNNLRLVNLPEGAEGPDTCKFLEGWLPEALEIATRFPLALERAHRVGPKRDSDAPPRTVIMRFLDYRQKELVAKAANAKKDILYKNHRVRFYSDVATEVHKQRKQFDATRQQLRQLGLRHGIIPPATLVLTYQETVHKFNSAADAQSFIRKIQDVADQPR
ncbi:unnamed protein product [Knipowitschia caucasica]